MNRLLSVTFTFLWFLGLTGCKHSSRPSELSTLDSYQNALRLVQFAHEVLGGTEHLYSSGGLYLKGEGTYDLSTRMQGKQPGVREPYDITEELAVDLKKGKVAYEYDTHVNPDAREWIRYMYDGQNRMLLLELYSGFAFWNSDQDLNGQSRRYTNMIPHLLLAQALDNRASLIYLGNDTEGNELVSFDEPAYGSLTLYIDSTSGLLTGVEYLKYMPLLGDTPIRWRFKEYKTVDRVGFYPTGYTVSLKGKLLKDINYTTIKGGLRNEKILTIPDSLDVPEMPDPPALGETGSQATKVPARDPIKLMEGVYVFPHIRTGFHPLVIEFNEFLMVVDAPAGWLELQQLPAMQWVEGASSRSTGRKLLDAICEKLSDKPVRYVVLTHHHSDHAGGIRPFIAEGAAILASSVTAQVIERALKNRFTLEKDKLAGKEIIPVIEIVDGERTISDGGMEVRLIDVGENPHSAGMLVAYLPGQKLLYQSDLFEPTPIRVFPTRSRMPVMKWFVNWLDNSGLEVESIYAIHAALKVTEEHLEKIRSID